MAPRFRSGSHGRRWLARLVVTAILVTVGAPLAAHASPAPTSDDVSAIVTVASGRWAAGAGPDALEAVGARVTARWPASGAVAVRLPADRLGDLTGAPGVLQVEPDHPTRAAGEMPDGVARVGIPDLSVAAIDGSGPALDVDIAVLDTGVDASHPDLRVAGGVDCTSGTCLPVEPPTDVSGHGTHVAGVAAARDDGAGVVGVAPGARVWSVKVLADDGNGDLSSLIAGLEWVAANAATIEVANVSLACDCRSDALDRLLDAVDAVGVTVVAAAGNDAADAAGYSPASHPKVLAVSAYADSDGVAGGHGPACGDVDDDHVAGFSNFGEVVDLTAPGVCVRSTLPGGGHGRGSGTSMAAPHVAGAAALYLLDGGLAAGPGRAEAVRDGLVRDWTVAPSSDCGVAGGRSDEPVLYTTACLPPDESGAPAEDDADDDAEGDEQPVEAVQDLTASEVRLAGADRVATAVQVSGAGFPDGAPAAVLARADTFPDALASAPLAAAVGGPILLTGGDALAADVAAELRRLEVRTVYLMGGTAALSSTVEDAVAAVPGVTTVRLAGADRYATGALAAERAVATWRAGGDAAAGRHVLVASGASWPDALAAAPLAAATRQPLLLTAPDAIPDATAAALGALGAEQVTILGGTSAVGEPIAAALERATGTPAIRIAGPDRYATALAVAAETARHADASVVVLASGATFPDALGAGAAVASRGGVLLLTPPDRLHAGVVSWLTANPSTWLRVAGGPAAVADAAVTSAVEVAGASLATAARST